MRKSETNAATAAAVIDEPETKARRKAAAAKPAASEEVVQKVALTISAPNLRTALFPIKGIAPLMTNHFSAKREQEMRSKMEQGSTARSKKQRDARNFEQDYQEAQYRSAEGWHGINASAFRCAAVDACRLVGFKMTVAKLSIFIEADGRDVRDGTPLVRIYGKPVMDIRPARNTTGVIDLRSRPRFDEWTAKLRVQWDQDQFTQRDVANLIMRVGLQVGVGEGRPNSRDSVGLGFGRFVIDSE